MEIKAKDWYTSKTIWAGILGVVFGIYDAATALLIQGCASDPVGLCYHLPAIPAWVFTILAGFGIYGRKTATTVIK